MVYVVKNLHGNWIQKKHICHAHVCTMPHSKNWVFNLVRECSLIWCKNQFLKSFLDRPGGSKISLVWLTCTCTWVHTLVHRIKVRGLGVCSPRKIWCSEMASEMSLQVVLLTKFWPSTCVEIGVHWHQQFQVQLGNCMEEQHMQAGQNFELHLVILFQAMQPLHSRSARSQVSVALFYIWTWEVCIDTDLCRWLLFSLLQVKHQ